MGLSASDAYNQIKNLENGGQLTLPEPQETVQIGIVDPAAGTFQWSVPTLNRAVTLPPSPQGGVKVNTVINTTMGIVFTKAVDLRVKFAVVPQKMTNANELRPAVAAMTTEAAAPGAPAAGAQPPTATARIIGTGATFGETNGGVTITGFPTVSSAATEITVDVGLICSAFAPLARDTTPQFTSFGVMVNIPGHTAISVEFYVVRPPVVGVGAFTLPALPMTVVYAPPQGKLLKNTATYSDTVTFSRTVTTAVTSSDNTKSVQAYSAADIIGKVADVITAVAAVVAGDPAGAGGGAAAGASVAGGLQEIATAIFGSPASASSANAGAADTVDASKQVSGELKLVQDILNAVDTSTVSTMGVQTNETDNSLTLTVTSMSQYTSKGGLGPGVGDRIIYLRNVRLVWLAVNGEVGICVLGAESLGSNAVQDLQAELQVLAGGGAGTLGLDAATIRGLLGHDVLVPPSKISVARTGPAVIGAPRFIPASPPGRNGSGTGSNMGDQFQVTFDSASEAKQVTTSTQTTITDAKPGWVSVLFGGDDTETTTTSTFTTTQTTDDKADDKVTSTVVLFSAGQDDPYDVKIFYDCLFGTYVVLNSNSSLLVGTTNANELQGR